MSAHRSFAARLVSVVIAVLPILPSTALAHDPGLSAAELELHPGQVRAEMVFAGADLIGLQTAGMGELSARRDPKGVLRYPHPSKSGARLLTVLVPSDGGYRPAPLLEAASAREGDGVRFTFTFAFPLSSSGAGAGARHFRLAVPVLDDLPRGHRLYLRLRDASGAPLVEALLDRRHPGVEVKLMAADAAVPAWRRGVSFLLLGIVHLLSGWDHLAFLAGLLVLGGRLPDTAKTLTAFTAAHSVTLSLAALEVVRLPAAVVEPLIAASVVYVALENLWRRDARPRPALAFGFGLLHGLGFAAVLGQTHLAGATAASVLLPLMAFNLGVELAQLGVALAVLPVVWRFERARRFPRFVAASSIALAALGAVWLVERLPA